MLIEITYNVIDVYMSTTETPVYVEISFEQPGGSAAVWGSITGTLSDQTDLQNALNLKVPYTGATTNVNLGEYELKAGQVTLDTSPTGTAAVGTIRWNDTTGTSETTLKGGNVILKNGVDLVARVVNKVTPNTTLTKSAYQAVRVSGAQGQRLAIELAQANNDAGSADTIGLVTETIAPNQEGFIMTVGQLEGINTTGSVQGETWADGDVLYLSPTTAGAITNVQPTGSGHIVVIGYVEYAHANNGKIYVKVLNGWELTELHDTEIISPANNEALIYESSSALWKNKSITTALGFTPANAATTLTINGVTYDLSANRSWTVAAGLSGTIATGQVAFGTAADTIGGSNNLFWDNANGRLGIGTNTPAVKLQVVGTSQTAIFGGTGSDNYITIKDSSGNLFIGRSTVYSYIWSTPNLPLDFWTNNAPRLRIFGGGNVLLQSGGTFTDNGQRLQVIGDTLLRGSGATSATTALTVQNSSSTNLFTVRNDGAVTSTSNFPNYRAFSTSVNDTCGYQCFTNNGTGNNSSFVAYGATVGFGLGGNAGFGSSSSIIIFGSNALTSGGTTSIRLRPSGYDTTADALVAYQNSISIGTTNNPVSSAVLDVVSTTKGFLPPRMTTTQKNAIASPAAGLVVYDTTLNKLCVYTTAWETITSI